MLVDLEARERSSPSEDTFGARAVAAGWRDDLTKEQYDDLLTTAIHRIGLDLAADGVRAVVQLPDVRIVPAYVRGLSDLDWRTLAEKQRAKREGQPPVSVKRRLPWCGKCAEGTRRLEDPGPSGGDLGPCQTCHPSRGLVTA